MKFLKAARNRKRKVRLKLSRFTHVQFQSFAYFPNAVIAHRAPAGLFIRSVAALMHPFARSLYEAAFTPAPVKTHSALAAPVVFNKC
jgi:hypothetical protein